MKDEFVKLDMEAYRKWYSQNPSAVWLFDGSPDCQYKVIGRTNEHVHEYKLDDDGNLVYTRVGVHVPVRFIVA